MKDVIFDYSKLRGKIRESVGSEKNFARDMGITQQALSSRLNNKTYFTDTEILKSVEVLDIDKADIGEYFFTPKVQKM